MEIALNPKPRIQSNPDWRLKLFVGNEKSRAISQLFIKSQLSDWEFHFGAHNLGSRNLSVRHQDCFILNRKNKKELGHPKELQFRVY